MSTHSQSPLVALEKVSRIGKVLERPESVLAFTDGTLAVSHRGRGISRIAADGTVTTIGPDPALAGGHELVPNGIDPRPDGSFLLANIGEGGGIWRLTPDGALTPHLMEADGVPAGGGKLRDDR